MKSLAILKKAANEAEIECNEAALVMVAAVEARENAESAAILAKWEWGRKLKTAEVARKVFLKAEIAEIDAEIAKERANRSETGDQK